MNFKNQSYNQFGTIDCEIEHPKYGWIPFTATPDDPETADIYNQIIVAGNIKTYTPKVKNLGAEKEKAKDALISLKIKEFIILTYASDFDEIDAATTVEELETIKADKKIK